MEGLLIANNMARTADLAHHFLEAVDQAAIASAAWRGLGDKNAADAAAVEAMRKTFDKVPFDGRVAIGEGERDDAPMLFIGEELGNQIGVEGALQIDIAVDPLECTNNCAANTASSERHRSVASQSLVKSSSTIFSALFSSSSERNTSLPSKTPPMPRIAVAVITPSGAAPIPSSMS